MIRIATTLIGLFLLLQAGAQNQLFQPRNFQKAYTSGTRSLDGKPGPSYWQNHAAYDIDAALDPKTLMLTGKEKIKYTNNSPDTLRIVRFKLIHDVYKKGAARDGEVAPGDVSDKGVSIAYLQYDGKAIPPEKRRASNTYMTVRLGESPIAPGASVEFEVAWSYKLPADDKASRECVCDPSTFFVPYWYPQIAVYDDYHGWADAPFTGTQEFYHEFADYDVTINMPKGYMVWATGEWQNASDLLQEPVLQKWQAAHQTATVSSIWKEADLKAGQVFKKLKSHQFHYKASNVPDFCFAASDHYNWDAASVVVDDNTGRQTFVSAAYDSGSRDFYQVADIASRGIRLMSTWLPGYPFPYPCHTVFNGNDGMEFPMMVNDASVSEKSVASLTLHETAHTYFPFMMGINEQEYAWMDEGWASFFDFLLADSLTNSKDGSIRGYANVAGTDYEVPPMVRARFLSGSAYGIASYSRPQAAYLTLLDLLGYDKFHTCMSTYMDRWKGKHPMPYDFFYTFNDVSGQNLNWFWKPWFFDWGFPDLGINGVVRDEAANADIVLIDRNGNIPIPVYLSITYTDGSTSIEQRTAEVWRNGAEQLRIAGATGKSISSAVLGSRTIPDTDRKNNSWKK
ncbi:MAG: M1 family metallopeptidase [Lewinellaceae bacterium]|nr:M1 family metallopeptidase [Lewinellaceae bacterium]